MSDNNKSEVQQSAEKVNPEQLQENLQQDKAGKPENLTEDQKTEFIEEDLRTDK